jgi:hypothetical protein
MTGPTKQIITTENVFYALSLGGQLVSPKFSNRVQAEMARASLPAEQQKLAEVIVVDSSSRQLLLG